MPWYLWGLLAFLVTTFMLFTSTLRQKYAQGGISEKHTDKENNEQVTVALVGSLFFGLLWPLTWLFFVIAFSTGSVLYCIGRWKKSRASKEYDRSINGE